MDSLPNVVALPLAEARAVLADAGWVCGEVTETRAPRMRDGHAREAAATEELLVVRQQVLDNGVVRLTVAAHLGFPTDDCGEAPSGGGHEV